MADKPIHPQPSTPAAGKTGSRRRLWLALTLVVILALAVLGVLQYRAITQRDTRIAALQEEKASLLGEQENLNEYISEVTETVNTIGTRVHELRERQVKISQLAAAAEGDKKQSELVMSDLEAIESQLVADRQAVSELETKMKNSAVKIRALDKLVADLRGEIEQNQSTITMLRNSLQEKEVALQETRQSLDETRTSLIQTEGQLDQTARTLEDTRNTAYYVVGAPSELEQKNIIDRQGWFWKKDLLLSNFNLDDFQKIDITQNMDFTLNARVKDLKLLPSRSAATYSLEALEDGRTLLKVVDRENFWKVPYLVVVVD